jgi:hypothetical protein
VGRSITVDFLEDNLLVQVGGRTYQLKYRFVDTRYLGTPKEASRAAEHWMEVLVTGSALGDWAKFVPTEFGYEQLKGVLFQYAEDHVKERAAVGQFRIKEPLVLTGVATPEPCKYDPGDFELSFPIRRVFPVEKGPIGFRRRR